PSEGKIHMAGQTSIAYFHQDLLSYETDRSVEDVARDAFQPLLDLQAEIDHLHDRMASGEDNPEIWNQVAEKQAQFESRGGKQIEAQVHTVLAGLGFKPEEHAQPYKTMSGGWRMRVLLAKMLLTQPDILLLDEPTNHLDLPSIQWLEGYLKAFPGTCILVSHDRFFIDRVASKIVEISFRNLHSYSGNYSFYLKEKALRHEQHQKAYESQQKLIDETEKFINRFRYKSTKAKQVQSRVKQLEKLERIEAPETESQSLSFRFKMDVTSGKEVLTLSDVYKAYDEKKIIENGQGTVWRGDKIALIGANGLGKSTLLRIIADTESFSGSRKLGHNVNFSFFAQHQLESLNLRNTILDEITGEARGKTEAELRTILGCFMFSGDDVLKPINVLSGGEKSRVALAKTLLSEANFLLLDEPTNHLDIQSIEILVQALKAYEGTYIVVSHDRFFLQKVANKIWYIDDRQIKEYPGTYEEYEWWLAKQNEGIEPEEQVEDEEKMPVKDDFKAQKQIKNRVKKLERQQQGIEEEITKLESQMLGLQEKMADPEVASDYGKLTEVQNQYEQLEQNLEKKTEEWEEVLLELEELNEE
ncbi:MAG: ABC-F family ATP-binding cassette domain-containing protein, partial [Bacteroidetes bacterium]|nr:ABC-F family ATP-binding cassette domain-containing protein [Bacteroidota bacterium]